MASRSKKKEIQCLNSDGISTLPQDITGNILTWMPIRDAIRTSILSRKWRSGWKSMTRLAFDDNMVKVPSNGHQLKKYKLASAILNVLLLHTGSIREIKFELGELDVGSEFDLIMCYLARYNDLQKLCFVGSFADCYELPSSFFSLQGLEVIWLSNCLFRPPIIFDGFSKLRTVHFSNVDITSITLQIFLSKCPLLRDLILIGDDYGNFATEKKFTFVELSQCVPLIEFLEIHGSHLVHLSAGGMPDKLPTSLVQLRSLALEVCYVDEDDLSSLLCLIRSSPNLEKIYLLGNDKFDTTQVSKNFPDIRDYSDFALDHLEFFWMKYFSNEDREVDFLKRIIAKSPMLKKSWIELDGSVSLEEENKMLRSLVQLQFPRASPSAKLIVERTKPYQDGLYLDQFSNQLF